jgi:hypothetical protein
MIGVLEREHIATQWAFRLPAGSDSGVDATRQLVEALSADLGTGSDPLRWLAYCSHTSLTRSWYLFDPEPQAPALERRPVSKLVDTVRSAFKLSITELASVLRVQRPTVYSWLKDNPELRQENEERLRLMASLADEWLGLVSGMQEPGSINGGAPSREFVARLSSSDVSDADGLRMALTDEATAVSSATGRSRFREDLKSRTPRRSESNFDVATGRPLGPQLIR